MRIGIYERHDAQLCRCSFLHVELVLQQHPVLRQLPILKELLWLHWVEAEAILHPEQAIYERRVRDACSEDHRTHAKAPFDELRAGSGMGEILPCGVIASRIQRDSGT